MTRRKDETEYPETRRLAGLARYEPESVRPGSVVSFLDADMSQVAAEAVSSLAAARPDAVATHVDAIGEQLDEGVDNRLVEGELAKALGAVVRVSPEALERLVSLAKSPSNVTRGGAVRGIGVAVDDDLESAMGGVDTAFERLTDVESVRRAAIDVLATIASADEDTLHRVRGRLDSSSGKERGSAARVLGRVVERRRAVGDVPVDAVRALLDDAETDPGDALKALDSIASVDPDAVKPVVDRALSYPERGEATTLLGTLADDPAVFEAMVRHLMEEGPEKGLLKAVGGLSDRHPEVVRTHGDWFLELLEHDHQLAQRYAANALAGAAAEDPEAVEFAIDPLLDRLTRTWRPNNWGARWATCEALAELAAGYPRIVTQVVELLDESPDLAKRLRRFQRRGFVRDSESAVVAAKWLARQHPTALYDAGAVPYLLDALDGGQTKVDNAARALASVGRVHPDALETAVGPLTDYVADHPARDVPVGVYVGLAEAAQVDPATVDRVRDRLFERFEDRRNRKVWDVVGVLASEYRPVFDRVAARLDGPERLHQQALVTLAVATREDPATARPHVDTLVRFARSGDRRSNATTALSGVAHGAADALAEHADLIAELLYDPDWLTRRPAGLAAAGLLAADLVAEERFVARLRRVLDDDQTDTRAAAAIALTHADRAVVDADELVDAVVPVFDLDRGDQRFVRRQAARVLARTRGGESRLRDIAETHDSPAVRRRVAAVLENPPAGGT